MRPNAEELLRSERHAAAVLAKALEHRDGELQRSTQQLADMTAQLATLTALHAQERSRAKTQQDALFEERPGILLRDCGAVILLGGCGDQDHGLCHVSGYEVDRV